MPMTFEHLAKIFFTCDTCGDDPYLTVDQSRSLLQSFCAVCGAELEEL